MAADTAHPSMKEHLQHYLQTARDAVLWKLEGLGEHDVRRPLTPTGTNLLGLVKHLAGVEAGYFGDTFERPFPEPLPWFSLDAELNEDMWARADEPREEVAALYRRVQAHADTTVSGLDLDTVGRVPWWPAPSNEVTLGQVLVRVVAETNRHAGHADVLRETIDGEAGYTESNDNLASHDPAWWTAYRARLQGIADSFR